jgi:hypothetical protein
VRKKLLKVASEMIEAAPDDLVMRNGRIEIAGAPGSGRSVAEVAAHAGATVACAVANATGKRVQELPLTPPRVLELLLDCKRYLTLPHIAEAWADNLVHPRGTAG